MGIIAAHSEYGSDYEEGKMSKKKAKDKVLSDMKSRRVIFVIGAIIMLLCAVGYTMTHFDYIKDGPKNIYKEIQEKGTLVKGDFVEFNANMIIDWYAETKHTVNGIPTGKELHCIAWLDNNACVSVTVKSGRKEELDKNIDGTQKYINYVTDSMPTSIKLEGRISDIGTEVSKYYDEAINAWGLKGSDDVTVYYVTVDTTDNMKSYIIGVSIMLVVAILFIVLVVSESKHIKNYSPAVATPAVEQTGDMTGAYTAPEPEMQQEDIKEGVEQNEQEE